MLKYFFLTQSFCSSQETGMTALMGAAQAGSLPLVRAILRRGGNPSALDKKRFTAVHYAAMGGFYEVGTAVVSAVAHDFVFDPPHTG